jgi:tRNA(adenine34) deaminase
MLHAQSHEHYMQMALMQAKMAYEINEIPVGAVVVCNHKVIAKAHNQVEMLQDVTAHAEMLAITAAQNHLGAKYLEDCSMYVTLEPCAMCGGALYWSQIGKIYIGAKDERRGFSRLQPGVLHPKTEVQFGIHEQECSELVSLFFSQIRDKQKRRRES